jgi:hypothetical protein
MPLAPDTSPTTGRAKMTRSEAARHAALVRYGKEAPFAARLAAIREAHRQRKAKGKGKGAKPKATPEQRQQARDAERQQNTDKMLTTVGMSDEAASTLTDIAAGNGGGGDDFGLVEQGILERDTQGNLRLSASGREFMSAAGRGDVANARAALSRGKDTAVRGTERDKAKADRTAAAEQHKAERDKANADKDAARAEREKAQAEKQKKGSSGGGGKGKATKEPPPDKAAERADNRTGVQSALEKGAGQSLNSAAFNTLTAFADGDDGDPQILAALADHSGLVERDSAGGYRMTSEGTAYVRAADRGNVRAAGDAMSRAMDRVKGKAQAEQDAATADAQATEDEKNAAADRAVSQDRLKYRKRRQTWKALMSDTLVEWLGEIRATKAQTAQERAMFANMGSSGGGGGKGGGKKPSGGTGGLWPKGADGERHPPGGGEAGGKDAPKAPDDGMPQDLTKMSPAQQRAAIDAHVAMEPAELRRRQQLNREQLMSTREQLQKAQPGSVEHDRLLRGQENLMVRQGVIMAAQDKQDKQDKAARTKPAPKADDAPHVALSAPHAPKGTPEGDRLRKQEKEDVAHMRELKQKSKDRIDRIAAISKEMDKRSTSLARMRELSAEMAQIRSDQRAGKSLEDTPMPYSDIANTLTTLADALAAEGDAAIKAGARHSGSDQEIVQQIFESANELEELAIALGADPGGDEDDEPEAAEEGGTVVEGKTRTPNLHAGGAEFTDEIDSDLIFSTLGGAIKALDSGDIGGFGVLFGDADNHDLSMQRDYFDAKTDFWLDRFGWPRPITYHHGMDEDTTDDPIIGSWTKAVVKPEGIWLEGQLDKAYKYHGAIKELIKRGALKLSSDSAPQWVQRERQPNGASYVKRWPFITASTTVTPAEPRMAGLSFKALMAEIGLNDKDDNQEADDFDGDRHDGAKADDDRARVLLLTLDLLSLEATP